MSLAAKFKSAAAAFRRSSITLGRDVDGLREQLRNLKTERDRIAALPVTKEAALGRLDAWVGGLRSSPMAGIEGLTGAMMVPQQPPYIDFLHGAVDAFFVARLGWAVSESIRPLLAVEIEKAYAGGVAGIDDAERERQLAKIDADIADCEVAEETMLRAAQEAGISIQRRPNADPRVVLARDIDLPS